MRSDAVDFARVEAGPVVLVVDDNDGGLRVSQVLDVLERGVVLAEVNDSVGDALAVECAVGRVALRAARLAVYSCIGCLSSAVISGRHGKPRGVLDEASAGLVAAHYALS